MLRTLQDADGGHQEAVGDALATMVSDVVESGRFLANILESSTEYSIIAKDLDRNVLSWNAGARINYGYEAHEVLGRSSDFLHHPSDLTSGLVQALHQEALREGMAQGRFRRLRKDGSMFVASVVITRRDDEAGRPVGFLVISRDITEEERLRQEADEYRRFLDNILESSTQYSIIAKDLDRNILSWNAGARINYGYEAHEVLGRSSDFLHEPIDLEQGTVDRLHARALAEGHAEGTFHRRRKDGSSFTASVVITRRDDAEGNPLGYLLISRDITQEQELRRASEERQRLLEEEDRRKDQFLATLAHELRNPLAPMAMASELLRHEADPENQRRYHDIIERQVGHLTRLVNDLLDVSRITRGKIQIEREPVSLRKAFQQGVEMAQHLFEKKRQTFEVHDDGPEPIVAGDSIRLAQVFGNLLRNAAKYTPVGGRVEAWLACEDDVCEVRIRDDGCGIAADDLTSIFDAFVQVGSSQSSGGLGIGLTLVKRIVDLHGGSVRAESPGAGQGSTFTVRLPAATAAAPDAHAPAGRRAGGTRRTVLVIDDHPDVVETLVALLQDAGHDVHGATGGAEGLRKAQELRPDVVVCDLEMPEVDGYETARRLRADPAHRGILLLALTGHVQDSHRARSREAGFDHHLAKPAAAGELLALIDSAAE